MIVAACQRWRERRDSYRPAGEVIETRRYEVAAIATDTEARAFVERHHYSATYAAAVRRFGLYRGAELVGVAVYSMPWPHVVAAAGLPFTAREVLELARFVLIDDVPGNGETWFLGRTRELLRAEVFRAVISFADDEPRQATNGRTVFPGHVGTIYQAFNAAYTGRGKGRSIDLLPDGTVLSDRAKTKIRRGERGDGPAIDLLVRHGARRPRPSECRRRWLAEARRAAVRPLRHPGCHRYAWALDRRARRHLPTSQRYPKLPARAA